MSENKLIFIRFHRNVNKFDEASICSLTSSYNGVFCDRYYGDPLLLLALYFFCLSFWCVFMWGVFTIGQENFAFIPRIFSAQNFFIHKRQKRKKWLRCLQIRSKWYLVFGTRNHTIPFIHPFSYTHTNTYIRQILIDMHTVKSI